MLANDDVADPEDCGIAEGELIQANIEDEGCLFEDLVTHYRANEIEAKDDDPLDARARIVALHQLNQEAADEIQNLNLRIEGMQRSQTQATAEDRVKSQQEILDLVGRLQMTERGVDEQRARADALQRELDQRPALPDVEALHQTLNSRNQDVAKLEEAMREQKELEVNLRDEIAELEKRLEKMEVKSVISKCLGNYVTSTGLICTKSTMWTRGRNFKTLTISHSRGIAMCELVGKSLFRRVRGTFEILFLENLESLTLGGKRAFRNLARLHLAYLPRLASVTVTGRFAFYETADVELRALPRLREFLAATDAGFNFSSVEGSGKLTLQGLPHDVEWNLVTGNTDSRTFRGFTQLVVRPNVNANTERSIEAHLRDEGAGGKGRRNKRELVTTREL